MPPPQTRDPIAIFKRIYDREIAAQTYLKEKDPYIIHAARVDEHFRFPITTLLCPALNYARYLLKGGVIRADRPDEQRVGEDHDGDRRRPVRDVHVRPRVEARRQRTLGQLAHGRALRKHLLKA